MVSVLPGNPTFTYFPSYYYMSPFFSNSRVLSFSVDEHASYFNEKNKLADIPVRLHYYIYPPTHLCAQRVAFLSWACSVHVPPLKAPHALNPIHLAYSRRSLQKFMPLSAASSTFSFYCVILANAQECCNLSQLQKGLLTSHVLKILLHFSVPYWFILILMDTVWLQFSLFLFCL